MANTIKLKQSSTPSKVPTTSDLALGELGVNTYDGKLYLKKNDGTASIVEVGVGGGASYSVGMMMMYAGSVAPSGWLLADGTAVSRTTYSVLFGVIGTTYGAGDGTTTFNLPDLARRIPMGKGASDALGASDAQAYASRTLAHSHSVPAHYHGMTGTGTTLAVDISHTHGTSSVTGTVGGADGTHTHTTTVTGNGAHSHAVTINVQQSANVGTGTRIPASGAGSSIASGNPVNWNTDGGHTHTVTVNSTDSGHGHGHSLTASGQTLGATSKTPTGLIGLVTGGVNGNASMTSGTATQPYLVVNHIIKY